MEAMAVSYSISVCNSMGCCSISIWQSMPYYSFLYK